MNVVGAAENYLEIGVDQLVCFRIRMPKAWRQCSICDTNSFKMSHLVIFKTPAKCGHGYRDVCELHFQPEDMRTHGDSKRYAFIIRPKTVQFGVGQS